MMPPTCARQDLGTRTMAKSHSAALHAVRDMVLIKQDPIPGDTSDQVRASPTALGAGSCFLGAIAESVRSTS